MAQFERITFDPAVMEGNPGPMISKLLWLRSCRSDV